MVNGSLYPKQWGWKKLASLVGRGMLQEALEAQESAAD